MKPFGRIRRFKILSSFTNIIQLPLIYIVFHMGFQPYFMYIIALLFGAIMTYSIALYCAELIVTYRLAILSLKRYYLYPHPSFSHWSLHIRV